LTGVFGGLMAWVVIVRTACEVRAKTERNILTGFINKKLGKGGGTRETFFFFLGQIANGHVTCP
jgi:hypothetical protein